MPSTVKIGATDVTIELKHSKEINGNYGRYKDANLLIEIANEVSPQAIAVSSFHEILHAIVTSQGLHLKLHGDQEEDIVRAFEVGLLGFFRDNPKYLKYLLESINAYP
jgi:hypothetical protein